MALGSTWVSQQASLPLKKRILVWDENSLTPDVACDRPSPAREEIRKEEMRVEEVPSVALASCSSSPPQGGSSPPKLKRSTILLRTKDVPAVSSSSPKSPQSNSSKSSPPSSSRLAQIAPSNVKASVPAVKSPSSPLRSSQMPVGSGGEAHFMAKKRKTTPLNAESPSRSGARTRTGSAVTDCGQDWRRLQKKIPGSRMLHRPAQEYGGGSYYDRSRDSLIGVQRLLPL